MQNKKTVFWESNPFSDVDSVITLPNDFKDCKIVCISLSKSGRLSNPYIMYKGYGIETGQLKFEVSNGSGWYAVPNSTNLTIIYKGNYGNLVIDIPYIVAFGIKQ